MCLLFLWQWGRTCVCMPAWNTWQSCVVPLDELPPLGWTLCQRCVTLHRCLGLWHPKPVVPFIIIIIIIIIISVKSWLGVGLLVVTIWLGLFTSYSCSCCHHFRYPLSLAPIKPAGKKWPLKQTEWSWLLLLTGQGRVPLVALAIFCRGA